MTETTKPKPNLARIETSGMGLVLNNLEDMQTVSQIILQSGIAPDSYKTKEQIFVGIQSGAEIGLKPMQALSAIVVINKKATLWGDTGLALVKQSGLCEYCREYFMLPGQYEEDLKAKKLSGFDIQYARLEDYPDNLTAVCETKAHRDEEPVIRYFSVADAKVARLWNKVGPWQTHPKRMLKYKARAFTLRDSYPDVLNGMHIAEEMIGEESLDSLDAPTSDVLPREDRRRTVPSSDVDTTRAQVKACLDSVAENQVLAEKAGDDMKGFDANGPIKLAEPEVVTGEQITASKNQIFADGEKEEAKTESELVVFLCKECGQKFQYGKEEGKGVPCECGKGILVEFPEQATDATIEEKGDKASLYIEVNGMYIEQEGKDFIGFAAYVLCLDDGEIAPSKLTEEQLKQIKAFIETNGVAIA